MCLLEMKVGERACIDMLNVDKVLKKRLNSFGFVRNGHLSVIRFSLFKSTVQVMVNNSLIALRKGEAKLIEVHKI